jgi:hypothetical protein
MFFAGESPGCAENPFPHFPCRKQGKFGKVSQEYHRTINRFPKT